MYAALCYCCFFEIGDKAFIGGHKVYSHVEFDLRSLHASKVYVQAALWSRSLLTLFEKRRKRALRVLWVGMSLVMVWAPFSSSALFTWDGARGPGRALMSGF